MPAERRRIAYIDGLRAVAVLLVIAHHSVVASTVAPRTWFEHVLKHGNHGVDLFFVLSGFCLSYPTIAAVRHDFPSRFDVSRYAAHRIVRILPPYWISYAVLLAFFIAIRLHGFPRPDGMPYFYSWLDLLKQIFFVDWHTQFLNGSFWTLPVEFRWYLVFPVLLTIWIKWPKWFVAIMVTALLFAQTTSRSLDVFFLPAFMLGIIAAELCVRRIRFGVWPGVATAATLAAALWRSQSAGWHDPFEPLWYLSAFSFVVWAGSSMWLERILSIRVLVYIGLASYSLYLMHQPVISFAEEVGVNRWIAALIGIAIGFGFWAAAERPFMMRSRIRERLLSEFQIFFARWLPRIGVPGSMNLMQTHAPRNMERAS